MWRFLCFLQVNLISPTGVSTTVATADSTVNWKDQVIKGSWDDVAAVQVVSTVTFTLTELALQAERCFEYATVDMQAVHSVSMIRWGCSGYCFMPVCHGAGSRPSAAAASTVAGCKQTHPNWLLRANKSEGAL